MPVYRRTLFLCAALAFANPAGAGLVGTPVTVTLTSPNGLVGSSSAPISASDSISAIVSGQGIAAGDTSNIGGFWMLPGEYINFTDSTINLQIGSGALNSAGDPVSGYASGGEYLFSGFAPSGNQTISAVTLSLAGGPVTNFSSSWVTLVSGTSVAFDLSQMTFAQGAGASNSTPFGDFTIQLSFATAPVPEPASLLLLLAGGAFLVLARRRAA